MGHNEYINQFLKPLEEKGVIENIEPIPGTTFIKFDVKETVCNFTIRGLIDFTIDEDLLHLRCQTLKDCLSIHETIMAPERKYDKIYRTIMRVKELFKKEMRNITIEQPALAQENDKQTKA